MKNFLKKAVPFFVCLAIFFCAASCGKTEKEEPEPAFFDPGSFAYAFDEEDTLEIYWGFAYRNDMIKSESAIIRFFNERYNIELGRFWDRGNMDGNNYQLIQAKRDKLPDIFHVTLREFDWEEIVGTGSLRTIPRDLIETYAPRYARLLTENGEWERYAAPNNGFRDAPRDELAFLPGYNDDCEMLGVYSIYSLDKLEKIGVAPKGNLVELYPNMFFCAEPFSFHEFQMIIEKSALDPETGYLFSLTGDFKTDREHDLLPLWGMFAIGDDYVKNGGKIIPFYASEEYRAFLEFVAEYANRNQIYFLDESKTFLGASYDVLKAGFVWTSVSTRENNGLNWIFNHVKSISSNFLSSGERFLITPAETNMNGLHEAVPVNGGRYFTEEKIAVSAATSDGKLARILAMFDDLSFDYETRTAGFFGMEGIHHSRETTATETKINLFFPLDMTDYILSFYTHVKLNEYNNTGTDYGANWLFDYARSYGSTIIAPVYRPADERAFYNDLRVFNLNNSIAAIEAEAARFYSEAVSGNADVLGKWDEYIGRLNSHGLQALSDLYTEHLKK